MGQAAEVLAELGIATETRVVSAHRTPVEMIAYGQQAAERGLAVIIAGAGGAAHLPGMLAAVTPLPVIEMFCAFSAQIGERTPASGPLPLSTTASG